MAVSDAGGTSSLESASRSRRIWPYALLAVLFGLGALTLWACLAGLVLTDREGCRYSPASIYDSRFFPPQGWCIQEGVATATHPTWTGPALVALLTATLLCASLAVMFRRAQGEGAVNPANRIALILILVTGATGSAIAARDDSPKRTAFRAAAVAAAEHTRQQALNERGRASHPDGPGTEPTPTPSDVRAQLEMLAGDALAAVPTGTLWLASPEVIISSCGGGEILSLTGRYTARDLTTAKDDADFNTILHANEDAAAAILEAWIGSSGAYDTLKGEYYFAVVGFPHLSAHLGFDEGVGEIEVTSLCAHP